MPPEGDVGATLEWIHAHFLKEQDFQTVSQRSTLTLCYTQET